MNHKKNKTRYKHRTKGLAVEVRNNDVNFALRKLKKLVQKDRILLLLREKEFYEKPSAKRKKEKAAGRARHLKKLEKQQIKRSFSHSK